MAEFDKKKFKRKLEIAIKQKSDLSNLKTKSLEQVAKTLLREIFDRVKSGISPISGKRFQAYKDVKKYPGDRKPQRPVNLFLSGQFLESLVTRIKTGKTPSITIFFDNQLANDKEQGHREGANGQRKRPIIPQGSEGFAAGILEAVRQVFSAVIDKDFK